MRILIPYFLFTFMHLLGFGQRQPVERYYLQTDKAGYVAGETIWFKAYVLMDFYPVEDASTLIVEMVGQNGHIITSKYLPITGGTATGNIDLPVSCPGGMYLLKMYTRLSATSTGPGEGYDKSVYVFNPAVKDSLTPAVAPTAYDFQFYPGSHTLVAGLNNQLHFKTTDPYHLPAHVEGLIRDSKDHELLRFKDQFEGAGKVEFTPAAGESYTAELSFAGGIKKTVPLPPVKSMGVTLQVETVPAGKRVQVTVTGAPFEDQPLTLIGVMANSVIFKKEVTIKDSYTCILPTRELPAGPVHLFVFDAGKKPLASLATFVTSETSFQGLDFSADTLNTSPGGTNVFSMKFPDSTIGTFSISITDFDREFSFSNSNIISDLLFSQQDRGQSTSSPSRMQADENGNGSSFQLLAATTEWPSVGFDEALNPVTAPRIADTNYLSISGKVYNKNADKLLKEGELNFVFKAKDSTTAFLSAPIEKDGSFALKNLLYYDTAFFKYQLNNKKTEILIKLDSLGDPLFAKQKNDPAYLVRPLQTIELKAEALAVLKLSHNYFSDTSASAIRLKEVILVSKTRMPTQIVNDKYTHGVFQSSGMARTVDLINYPPNTTAGNILDYLQGKITGLSISKNGLTYTLTSQRQLSISNNPPIKLFLDEREITTDFLLPIPIREIALVKYYPPGNNLPGVGIAGVLSIYTKKISDLHDPIDPSLKNGFSYPGYSAGKNFTGTGTGDEPAELYPAKTLYWNPNILVDDATQPYQVKFKNNSAKRFHVVIEGFTTDGKLLYFEKILSN